MPEIDSLILIDANKYLDLYRTDKGRKLLAPLSEQAPYIFVTQQIVDEVQRNKLRVASDFLRTKSQGLKLQGINVPDHFSGSVSGKNEEILRQMRGISKSVSSVNAEIDAHMLEIMNQVAESQDEVSKALAPIFSKAVLATADEVKRARERKEIGNPPGKRNDPLGDEITWEQVLSHFSGKRRLWIISRDGDYGTGFGGDFFLNSFLKSELAEITNGPIVYIFEDLVDGLTHFVETTNVKAKIKLTQEEITEIETEERLLPPIEASRYASSSSRFLWPTAEMQGAIDSVKPTAEMLRALEVLKPTAEALRVMAAMQPTAEMVRIAEAMKPTAEMLRAIEAMQPTAEVLRALEVLKPTAEMLRSMEAMKSIEDVSNLKAPRDDDE